MKLLQIFKALSDETRLRILHLLDGGPLCVCHLQEILGGSQVRISKHLAYLRGKGLVSATRRSNWMIYSLPKRPAPALAAHLAALRSAAAGEPRLRTDLKKLNAMRPKLGWLAENDCCGNSTPGRAARKRPQNSR